MQYRIEPRYPCYINGDCMPETCYFVQVLKEGFLFSKWVDIKGFATKKKAQEFKKNVRIMNREILFRGQRLDNGEWVYGGIRIVQGRYYIIPEDSNPFGFEVDPATVGQYTGQNAACKDSQGPFCHNQQVFEHDILADQNGNILGCVKFTDEHGWMVGVESLYDYTDRYDEKEALIIGNIFDNPSMLKGGEK